MPVFQDVDAHELFAQLQRTAAAQGAAPAGLPELVMHVADGCNLACTYCFADGGRYGDQKQRWMSDDVARSSIESVVAQYGSIGKIKFFGGEPTLNVPAIRATINTLHRLIDSG
ncbi:MAG: radical SAM protein, partial [Candidatus Nanopelagicales bacterium]